MKYLLLSLFILIPVHAFSQPALDSLQQVWVQSLKSRELQGDFYLKNHNFIYAEIDSSVSSNILDFISSKTLSESGHYVHVQNFRQDDLRYITTGYLDVGPNKMVLVSAWWNIDGEWKKGLDVVLSTSLSKNEDQNQKEQVLDRERKIWVQLANRHQPMKHVSHSYTEDALYFGNARKSTGHAEIAERYSYMENPDYQIELDKERLFDISESKVLEVGRYFTGPVRRGSGGLYIILWEKQLNGNWKIALDFNF